MQLPKHQPKQDAKRKRCGKENPRFRHSNQRYEHNAKGNNKSDRMASKAPRSIFSEWNDIFWMQLICARSGGRNVSVREMTESSHAAVLPSRYNTPPLTKRRIS